MSFKSYAQNFEDVMLWRALKHVKNGTYVDVGAQHPEIDSVSKSFYELGWRGIHIEPVHEYAELLRKNRPDETVLEVALGDAAGVIELHVISDTGLSTAVDSHAQRHRQERGYEHRRMQVPVLTLKSSLNSLAGKDVHWLKIDVEGFEEKVLRGWDSKTLRPWIMVVEATIPNSKVTDYEGWDPILAAADYQYVYFDGLNRFYVAKEHSELAAAFSCPPNVFDDVVLTENSDLCREVTSLYRRTEALLVQAEAQTKHAEARAKHAETQAEHAEMQAEQAHARADHAEMHAKQAHARAEHALADLHHIIHSRSWRATAAPRLISHVLRRLMAAMKPASFNDRVKKRAEPVLRKFGRWVLSKPTLKRTALWALNRVPAVKHRLRRSWEKLTPHVILNKGPAESGDLTPRAARIYADLQKASGRRKS